MRKQSVKAFIQDKWQSTVIGLLAFAAISVLLLFNLKEIAPFVAPNELNITFEPIANILKNPVHLHHQIIQKIVFAFTNDQLLAVRFSPYVAGVAAIFSFYWICLVWLDQRVAVFGTILFSASSWLLHVSRIGLTDSSYLLLLVPVLGSLLLKLNRYNFKGALLLLYSGLVLIYVPGFIWLVLPFLFLQRKLIIKSISILKMPYLVLMLVSLVIGLIPMLYALINDISFIKIVLAIPEISKFAEMPSYLLQSISSIFVTRDSNSYLGIASIPFLNISMISLFIVGLYSLYLNKELIRARYLVGFILLGFVMNAISLGAVPLTAVMPLLFIVMAYGISYLIQVWLSVFPRNPLADKAAIFCIALIVGMSVSYEFLRYFVAWPHSQDHSQVFELGQR